MNGGLPALMACLADPPPPLVGKVASWGAPRVTRFTERVMFLFWHPPFARALCDS